MSAMRCFRVWTTLLAVGLIAPLATATISHATEKLVEDNSKSTTLSRTERLNQLFSDLKRQRDPDAAKTTTELIRSELTDSGSATINLLMQWSDEAVRNKRNDAALDFLDQITILKPDFAEGWNHRAKLHFLMGNKRKAMADLNQVLAIEPRHIGALSGLATILAERSNDELALKAWEQLLEVYPADRRAQEQVSTLAEKIAGRGI